jgi:hypothetical protein
MQRQLPRCLLQLKQLYTSVQQKKLQMLLVATVIHTVQVGTATKFTCG